MNSLQVAVCLLALLLAGCAAPQLPAAPGTGPFPQPTTAPVQLSQAEALAVIAQAHMALVQLHVDRPEPGALLDAAWQGIVATRLGRGATDFSATDTEPSDAWQRFQAAYAGLPQYADGAAHARLAHAAVAGMATSLNDCHTEFISPREFARQTARIQGAVQYGGVGIRIKRRGDEPVVVWELLEGGSAGPAGLRPGDMIEQIDGQPVVGMTLGQVAALIRGPVGTEVQLSVRRSSDQKVKRYRLERVPVEEPVFVSHIMDNSVGFMRIYRFSDGVDRQVVAALREFEQAQVRGWVVDVRTNSGGSLPMLLGTLSKFLKKGPFAYHVDRSGRPQAYGPDNTYWPGRHPRLVVLVSETTSSAAEVFAAALQYHQVGTVAGVKTAGCVGVAQRLPLPDGSGLTVKVSKLSGPDGSDLNRVGLSPDVVVEQTLADLAAGRDPQLQWALKHLAADGVSR